MVYLIQHKSSKFNYELKKGFFNLQESNKILGLRKKLGEITKKARK